MSRRRTPISGLPLLRRRSTLWLLGGLVLLAVAAILGAISRNGAGPQAVIDPTPTLLPAQEGSPAPPTPVSTITLPAATDVSSLLQVDPSLLTPARVLHVVDGDTIDVELNGEEERVRYYGIDTQERGDRCFDEATDRNTELIGANVLLLDDARNRDRSGRLLRYVFDASGRSVDARLVAEGLAYAWRDDGAYRNDLIALEEQAQAAGAGCLWE